MDLKLGPKNALNEATLYHERDPSDINRPMRRCQGTSFRQHLNHPFSTDSDLFNNGEGNRYSAARLAECVPAEYCCATDFSVHGILYVNRLIFFPQRGLETCPHLHSSIPSNPNQPPIHGQNIPIRRSM